MNAASLSRAVTAHRRAVALRETGRFAAAEAACRRAVVLYRAGEGHLHPDVANALVELGLILETRDRLPAAAGCVRRALAILERYATSPDRSLARLRVQARVLLGAIARKSGDLRAAARNYECALRDVRRRFGPRHPYAGTILINQGVVRKNQGRYAEAKTLYRRARALISPRDTASRATLAHNLGGIEHALGHHAAAEVHARQAVRLRARLLGPSHPAVAADIAAMAAVVESRRRLGEAAALFARALAIFRRRLGAWSLEVGSCLAGLARVEQRRGRRKIARRMYLRGFAIQRRCLGQRHPDLAMTANNLATLEREDGKLERAAVWAERAAATFRATVGPRHPDTRIAFANRRNLRRLRSRSIRGGRTAPTQTRW